MELSDLRRMSPLWLKYSEDVRADPDVRLSDPSCALAAVIIHCFAPNSTSAHLHQCMSISLSQLDSFRQSVSRPISMSKLSHGKLSAGW